MSSSQETFANTLWYGKYRWLGWLLSPLSLVFWFLSGWRRRHQQAKQVVSPFPVPVIVIGNISVGGVGKTPLIISLCQQLKEKGINVGVVSRGHGGHSHRYPLRVNTTDNASETGDEPLLIAQLTACPVVVDPDRTAAVDLLVSQFDVDIVLSDDGMQHYRLWRDKEIAVIDGRRCFGNGLVLPGGPLRETSSRLASVDAVVVNGEPASDVLKHLASYTNRVMLSRVQPIQWRKLECPHGQNTLKQIAVTLDDNPLQGRVLAFAGIGNPGRFYSTLRRIGLSVDEKSFADHYHYCASDILTMAELGLPLVTTAKDAVKLAPILESTQELIGLPIWVLDVGMKVPDELLDVIVGNVEKDGQKPNYK
ncbi:tetraacyldisaccharide 4'-kinase [Aurantivibrio plasticivorans]